MVAALAADGSTVTVAVAVTVVVADAVAAQVVAAAVVDRVMRASVVVRALLSRGNTPTAAVTDGAVSMPATARVNLANMPTVEAPRLVANTLVATRNGPWLGSQLDASPPVAVAKGTVPAADGRAGADNA